LIFFCGFVAGVGDFHINELVEMFLVIISFLYI
jgi:hypothetical protein